MDLKTLLLYDYPETPLEISWTLLKVFIKEGFLGRNWSVFTRNRKVGGSLVIPQALVQGLNEIHFPIKVNQYHDANYDVVVVLKNHKSLLWALEQKKKGRIKKLLAGPFIATLPYENRRILYSSEIDGLLFLSDWHRNLFLKYYEGSPPRDYLWFSGVDTQTWCPHSKKNQEQILIYLKASAPNIYPELLTLLRTKGLAYKILTYGQYSHSQFLAELLNSKLAIFLSQSETQGVALLECWSMNVPSLVWNPQKMLYFGQTFEPASSCPYLSPQSGFAFQNLFELEKTLTTVLENSSLFHPRQYVLDKFSLSHSAQRFKEILYDILRPTHDENFRHYSHI